MAYQTRPRVGRIRRWWSGVGIVALLAATLALHSAAPAAAVDLAPSPSGTAGKGYFFVATDGGIFNFGDSKFYGSTGDIVLNRPIVGAKSTRSGNGYWLVASDGGIFAFGDARFLGSTGGTPLNAPIVGMAVTPSGNGYWLVATDGGIFSFGDAAFYGSTGAIRLNSPIVGMEVTPGGGGYWLVAADGGIFTFGTAEFLGSAGAIPLNKPIVGMAATEDGDGYYLVATDGGIFSYGDAAFYGSTGALTLNSPVVGMDTTTSGKGYYLVAADGGIFTFGDAIFYGSTGALRLNRPIVGMSVTPFSPLSNPDFVVNLRGSTEVPGPGDPDGTGIALLDFTPTGICYAITVSDTTPSVAAHIHMAPAGVSGPVVVPLTAPDPTGVATGCAVVSPALINQILADPAGFYVNLHSGDFPNGSVRGQLEGQVIVAATADNRLVVFNTEFPRLIIDTVAVTGLGVGETIVGLDVRPNSGVLYALTNSAAGLRLYTINDGTNVATQVGVAPIVLPGGGTAFGFDFNPTVDMIRVVSNTGANTRLDPNLGTSFGPETSLAFAPGDVNAGAVPSVAGSAYVNVVPVAASATLYGIDTTSDSLVTQNGNSGVLTTVGALGVNASTALSLDISKSKVGESQTAIAVMATSTGTGVYAINLTTGRATLLGPVGSGNLSIVAGAIFAVPTA